jgi:hypothetical protein
MKAVLLKIVLAACCAAVCAPRAWACKCEAVSLSKAKGRAEVVFAGTVLDSHRERTAEGFEWRVRLSVEQSWKGDAGEAVVVYTSGGCEVTFEAGKRYLVFARRQEGRGRLVTDLCMMTRLLDSSSEEDLRGLGKAKQKKNSARGDAGARPAGKAAA